MQLTNFIAFLLKDPKFIETLKLYVVHVLERTYIITIYCDKKNSRLFIEFRGQNDPIVKRDLIYITSFETSNIEYSITYPTPFRVITNALTNYYLKIVTNTRYFEGKERKRVSSKISDVLLAAAEVLNIQLVTKGTSFRTLNFSILLLIVWPLICDFTNNLSLNNFKEIKERQTPIILPLSATENRHITIGPRALDLVKRSIPQKLTAKSIRDFPDETIFPNIFKVTRAWGSFNFDRFPGLKSACNFFIKNIAPLHHQYKSLNPTIYNFLRGYEQNRLFLAFVALDEISKATVHYFKKKAEMSIDVQEKNENLKVAQFFVINGRPDVENILPYIFIFFLLCYADRVYNESPDKLRLEIIAFVYKILNSVNKNTRSKNRRERVFEKGLEFLLSLNQEEREIEVQESYYYVLTLLGSQEKKSETRLLKILKKFYQN